MGNSKINYCFRTSNRGRKSSLDSVVNQSIDELEETQNEELKEELQSLEKLEKKGADRKKQAEQSAQKLKELLSEKTVDIQIDNINRLKRLLKTSGILVYIKKLIDQ